MAELRAGIVLMKVLMGLANSEMRDRAVKALEVSSVLPLNFAVMTNTAKVTNGAMDCVLLASMYQCRFMKKKSR